MILKGEGWLFCGWSGSKVHTRTCWSSARRISFRCMVYFTRREKEPTRLSISALLWKRFTRDSCSQSLTHRQFNHNRQDPNNAKAWIWAERWNKGVQNNLPQSNCTRQYRDVRWWKRILSHWRAESQSQKWIQDVCKTTRTHHRHSTRRHARSLSCQKTPKGHWGRLLLTRSGWEAYWKKQGRCHQIGSWRRGTWE